MEYVNFLGHKVSKLIIGDNPFNGHSYITDFVPGADMRNYYTEEKILEEMHKMEELGINTMLPLADPYIIRILQRYRNSGGKMNFIFQTWGPLMTSLQTADITIQQMMSVDPIGLYLSGTYNDVRFETGRNDEIVAMLGKLKESGVPVGFGTHHPELVELCEKEGWDVDFYMACMYNLRRQREGEESGFITGKSKSGIVIVPEDRPVMLNVLKNIEKPIIAFKIFAGGQMLVQHNEEERRALIKNTYDTIFTTLKPNDIAVAGVFSKYHDQLTENVSVFNEWHNERTNSR
ncbi:MAG: hypothetical protein J6A69_04935 [Clostridia bacterium]|nr:hypothetical protein [Clostridia bacterium]